MKPFSLTPNLKKKNLNSKNFKHFENFNNLEHFNNFEHLKIFENFDKIWKSKKKRIIEQKIKQIPLPYLDGWASWMGMSDKFIKKLKLFENVRNF